MALYAFDGTWNKDEDQPDGDTNVVKFKELYADQRAVEYVQGVGTRYGKVGAVFGGLFGTGGRTRIQEMYEELCKNYKADKVIDIVGFSRGAALAVHFANKIAEEGIKLDDGSTHNARIRFLGVWDIVGSFGLSFDTVINFQDINLGWDIDTVDSCVDHCFHAMALDERRETFALTRLDENNRHNNVIEVWFRGVHSDIGGGNENIERSNIALNWMLEKARACGLVFNEDKAKLPKYSRTNRFARVREPRDLKFDKRRKVSDSDTIDLSSAGASLAVGEGHTCEVFARQKYNWSGVSVKKIRLILFQLNRMISGKTVI